MPNTLEIFRVLPETLIIKMNEVVQIIRRQEIPVDHFATYILLLRMVGNNLMLQFPGSSVDQHAQFSASTGPDSSANHS